MSKQTSKTCSSIFCRRLLCITAILVTLPVIATANPRSDFPDTPMGAHGTIKGAKEQIKLLYELYAAEEKTCLQMVATKESKPEGLPYKQIASSAGKVWMAERHAKHLQLMGEPAAYDLERKFRNLALEFRSLAVTYIRTPPGARNKVALMNQLNKQKPARDKKIVQGQQMVAQNQLETAEKLLAGLGTEIYEQVVFINPSENKPYWLELTRALGECDTKLSAKRKVNYQQQAMKVIEDLVTESRKFEDEAERIRQQIESDGSATLPDDTKVDAVAAFAYVAGLWGKSSAMLMRCQGVYWAFAGDDGSGSAGRGPAAKEAQALAETAKKKLSSLIVAAAKSTPSNQMAATYAGLLREISIVNRRATSGGITSSCQDALKQLAKGPLASQAANYDRATSEPLKWRALFAKQQADALAKEYYTVASRMGVKHLIQKTNRPEVFGKPSTVPVIVTPKSINLPANWSVYEAATAMLGQKMSDQPMVRLSPTSATAVVPFAASHYANVAVPLPIDDELAELRRCLMVDETHLPLSIDAADAISAAELQDFESVGGMVSRLHLEAVVTRFVAIPDIAYVLCPLGRLPSLVDNTPAVTQSCWRFDIIPHWAQHKYFTVKPVAVAQ